jgi:hypothetical protein
MAEHLHRKQPGIKAVGAARRLLEKEKESGAQKRKKQAETSVPCDSGDPNLCEKNGREHGHCTQKGCNRISETLRRKYYPTPEEEMLDQTKPYFDDSVMTPSMDNAPAVGIQKMTEENVTDQTPILQNRNIMSQRERRRVKQTERNKNEHLPKEHNAVLRDAEVLRPQSALVHETPLLRGVRPVPSVFPITNKPLLRGVQEMHFTMPLVPKRERAPQPFTFRPPVFTERNDDIPADVPIDEELSIDASSDNSDEDENMSSASDLTTDDDKQQPLKATVDNEETSSDSESEVDSDLNTDSDQSGSDDYSGSDSDNDNDENRPEVATVHDEDPLPLPTIEVSPPDDRSIRVLNPTTNLPIALPDPDTLSVPVMNINFEYIFYNKKRMPNYWINSLITAINNFKNVALPTEIDFETNHPLVRREDVVHERTHVSRFFGFLFSDIHTIGDTTVDMFSDMYPYRSKHKMAYYSDLLKHVLEKTISKKTLNRANEATHDSFGAASQIAMLYITQNKFYYDYNILMNTLNIWHNKKTSDQCVQLRLTTQNMSLPFV